MRFALTGLLSLAYFGAAATTASAQKIDFNRDVRPIISNHCLACHGPDDAKRQAGLRLDDSDVATKILESGHAAIVAGNASASELIARITSDDESVRMPPTEFSKPLTATEIATLQRWVEQGGQYARHWAYVKPIRAEPPVAGVPFANWPRNAIDNFALHRMLELGLKPTEQADARSLVRRVFLDLIGIPPTVDECDTWAQRLEAGAAADTESLFGIYAAAGTPRDIVTRLNREISRGIQSAELTNTLNGLGAEGVVLTADEFADRQRRDRERFGAFIREAGIKVQ